MALVVSAVADTALPVAFGHDGIIGGENAPPVNFENMEVTVYTYITPYPLEAGGEDTVNLKIRFLDRLTGDTFEEVVYRIDIWKAEQLLARSIFYDSDGVLYIEVRPDGNCDTAKPWRCTSYEGSEHPTAPGALYVARRHRVQRRQHRCLLTACHYRTDI